MFAERVLHFLVKLRLVHLLFVEYLVQSVSRVVADEVLAAKPEHRVFFGNKEAEVETRFDVLKLDFLDYFTELVGILVRLPSPQFPVTAESCRPGLALVVKGKRVPQASVNLYYVNKARDELGKLYDFLITVLEAETSFKVLSKSVNLAGLVKTERIISKNAYFGDIFNVF